MLKSSVPRVNTRGVRVLVQVVVISVSLTTSFVVAPSAGAAGAALVSKPGIVFVDVPSRRSELGYMQSDANRLCPGAAVKSVRPVPFIEATGAPVGDAINSVSPITDLSAACLRGDLASCDAVVQILDDWARSDALAAREVVVRRGAKFWDWTLSGHLILKPMISAYAIARASVTVPSEVDKRVLGWLDNRVRLYRNDDEWPAVESHNHIVLSSSVGMAYGSLAGEDSSFREGLSRFRLVIDSLGDDGSFPHERERGGYAIWYSLLQLNLMVGMGEVAANQGHNLYAYRSAKAKTIHDAVAFVVAALQDNDVIIKYARANVYPHPGTTPDRQVIGWDGLFAWMEPYLRRFPNHAVAERLRRLEVDRRMCEPGVQTLRGCAGASRKLIDLVQRPLKANWFGGNATCFSAKSGTF